MDISNTNIKKINEYYGICLDDTEIFEGVKVYRLIALKDLKIAFAKPCLYGIDVSKGTFGGYISEDTILDKSWVNFDCIVIGFRLLETKVSNSSTLISIKDDKESTTFQPAFVNRSCITRGSMIKAKRIFLDHSYVKFSNIYNEDDRYDIVVNDSFITASDIYVDKQIGIYGSNILKCCLNGNIYLSSVDFKKMKISNKFSYASNTSNNNKLNLHGLELSYDDPEVKDKSRYSGQIINDLGSRNDNLCIYTVYYRNKDEETESFKPELYTDTYVSTGCFCGTLDEFKQKVEETYGDTMRFDRYSFRKSIYIEYMNTIQYIESCIDNQLKYLNYLESSKIIIEGV